MHRSATLPGMDGNATYKWQRIANDLREKIDHGEFPPGSLLPSESALMDQYRVAHATVRRALVELRIEGLVYPQHGRGVVVLDPPEPIL